MKERYKEWAKLTARPLCIEKPESILMRQVAGILALEDKLLLYSDRHGTPSDECQDQADELCRQIFGVANCDTEFRWPVDFDELEKDSPEQWAVYQQFHEHEALFETPRHDQFQRLEFLKSRGLDFTGTGGQPLKCLFLFHRAAEAAAKRMKGFNTRLPTAEEVSAASFKSSIAAAANAFMKQKRQRE